jgi:hypothetical protein
MPKRKSRRNVSAAGRARGNGHREPDGTAKKAVAKRNRGNQEITKQTPAKNAVAKRNRGNQKITKQTPAKNAVAKRNRGNQKITKQTPAKKQWRVEPKPHNLRGGDLYVFTVGNLPVTLNLVVIILAIAALLFGAAVFVQQLGLGGQVGGQIGVGLGYAAGTAAVAGGVGGVALIYRRKRLSNDTADRVLPDKDEPD